MTTPAVPPFDPTAGQSAMDPSGTAAAPPPAAPAPAPAVGTGAGAGAGAATIPVQPSPAIPMPPSLAHAATTAAAPGVPVHSFTPPGAVPGATAPASSAANPFAPSGGAVPTPPAAPQTTPFTAPPAALHAPAPGASPFAAPHRQSQFPQLGAIVDGPPAAPSPRLGWIALLVAILALLASAVAGPASWPIGEALTQATLLGTDSADLSWLSPVKNDVLVVELSFWFAVIAAATALVTGIVAIRRKAGRRQGVAAVCLAVAAPVLFVIVVSVVITGALTTL